MAEQIADEILSGRIPGGSQLKQEELAEAFEASRIPIREAFQILENQGLIIRLATRRITVTELDEEQICLIYSMISEMTKKALNSLKHSKRRKNCTKGLRHRDYWEKCSRQKQCAIWWKMNILSDF